MSSPHAYWNGGFLAAAEVAVPLGDAGFVWGATATDRVRTYGGKLFRLPDHLARFRQSCEMCRIPQPVPDAELAAIAEQLVEHNRSPETELVLVMFATPGDGRRPTLCLHTTPFSGEPYRPLLERGANLVTPSVRHVPPESVPRGAKQRSRMAWWIAEQRAQTFDPDAHALLLDDSGSVTETCLANFAVVRGKTIYTPPRAIVLDGVSLRVVAELCGPLGLTVAETPLRQEDCYTADEALLTSTPFGVAGVSRLNGRPIPWPGPVLGKLRDAWNRLVSCDIWHEILPQT